MSAYVDAGSIGLGIVGVLLVAAFSMGSDRDGDGYGTLSRWIDLEKSRPWGSRWFVGLDWKRADGVARWFTRIGYVLIVAAAIVQIVRVSQ